MATDDFKQIYLYRHDGLNKFEKKISRLIYIT